ncbi:MAG TPA: hypothetical protein VMR95_01480 [Candidatus Binatia bacterium]|jgi:hypothetical protein|nr:hypothetical protein [Candidatus Binatia bacterium]
MKNVTLSAQEEAIEKVRKIAVQQHSTLNEMFREWLSTVGQQQLAEGDVETKLTELWKRTGHLRVGKKLTREEMNER